jgi:hypothetical protein
VVRTSPARSPLILTTERGRAWGEDHFRHLFAELRKLAELPRDFQYRDLRRSAVICLARAGCAIPEIAANFKESRDQRFIFIFGKCCTV